MKEEEEIKSLLAKLESNINRLKLLKNPPEHLKMENCNYRILLAEMDVFKFILGYSGYDYEGSYESLKEYLNSLEEN